MPMIANTRDREHNNRNRATNQTRVVRRPRVCSFCTKKSEPDYKDALTLARFLNDRGKIVASFRSGTCASHQRQLTQAIKRARHLALVPFVTKVH